MANENLFSSMFWMYFSYTLSFVIPLFCGLTLLTVKGPSDTKQAGIHPRYLLGIIFTLTGFLFIPNMIQDIYKYNTGISGLLTFDITVNLFLIPLYFFYFRKLTKPKKLKTWEASLHFYRPLSCLPQVLSCSPPRVIIYMSYHLYWTYSELFALLFKYFYLQYT